MPPILDLIAAREATAHARVEALREQMSRVAFVEDEAVTLDEDENRLLGHHGDGQLLTLTVVRAHSDAAVGAQSSPQHPKWIIEMGVRPAAAHR